MSDEPETTSPLPNGCTLYWEANQVGGRTYFSDEVGGGVFVWDTCLVGRSTLIAAIAKEYDLEFAEKNREHKPRSVENPPADAVKLRSIATEIERDARVTIYDELEQIARNIEALHAELAKGKTG